MRLTTAQVLENVRRAERAEKALKAHVRATGERWEPGCEADNHLTDLLTDLMHWCDWKHLATFEVCHGRAGNHFEAEKRGDD